LPLDYKNYSSSQTWPYTLQTVAQPDCCATKFKLFETVRLLHKESKHTTHDQIVCATACVAQAVWPCMGPFWTKVVGQTVGLKWAASKWLSLLCCEESLPHCCIGLTLMSRDRVCYVLSAVVTRPKIIKKFLPHDVYYVNSWNRLGMCYDYIW
jgi:hypothetical protein